jgi:molecular chaperone DnaK (HSP70)
MPSESPVPSLASCLARGSGRAFQKRMERARYYAGIDLGTTNSSVTLVDALALLRGDTEAAVRVLPIRQRTARGVVLSPYLASVVAEVEPRDWWVGQGAREARTRGLLRGRQLFYSTKLEMGLGREPFYPHADSPEYDSPYKVAGRILQELRRAVEDEAGEQPLGTIVVTVPASFQLAARQDTFRAAKLAGMELREQSLLDEPNAAFLDYILTCRHQTTDGQHFDLTRPKNVLVFDFGGGTCDVSVLRVHADPATQGLSLANLSIARYEHLGGDNVDAAIVEQVLLPQLLKQNGLESLDLSWSEKKERILPQLLGVAEALKLRVCGGDAALPRAIQVDLPPRPGRPLQSFTFVDPAMTRAQFEKALEPFLDADFLYPRDTELTPVASIFGPVTNALQGARLQPEQVDALLLVGGSSLIPQVQKALTAFFPKASVLGYPDAERTLLAVTRGAALQAFFVHAFGRPLLNPIAQESLGVLTQQGGFVELVPRGAELPFPADGEPAHYRGLVVPRDLMMDVEIVVAAGGAQKPLGIERLHVPVLRSAGEPIDLRYRLDANKVLTVTAELANHKGARCTVRLENPLCAVAFGSERQKEIAELEAELARTSPASSTRLENVKRERLAGLYKEEGKLERAIDEARKTMEADRRPNEGLLNTIASCYDQLGSPERAEKHYREALRVAPGSSATRFNLSLLLERRGRLEEATVLAAEAAGLDQGQPVFRGWLAVLWQRQGKRAEMRPELERAAAALDALPSLDDWQRHWRGRFARELGDPLTAARLEKDPGPAKDSPRPYDESRLPGHTGALARRAS